MIHEAILAATGASDLKELETIQELWSGYGTIKRYELSGSKIKRVVVKHVDVPESSNHPRGWNSDISHQRKLKSYKIELEWYKNWSERLDADCYVPRAYGFKSSKSSNSSLLILEDLDEAGFTLRKKSVSLTQAKNCLSWLANFHASFLGEAPKGLWTTGTYWHLDTRPDELEALDDIALKQAAAAIDQKLRDCPFQSLVHGDAKLANFCFSPNGEAVSAVDFQYVGGGCGMKDVAYFIGSCFSEKDCERHEEELLDFYFANLVKHVSEKHSDVDADELCHFWRELFPFAWADFHRFIKGWSPGHWKINSYSERVAREVVANLCS